MKITNYLKLVIILCQSFNCFSQFIYTHDRPIDYMLFSDSARYLLISSTQGHARVWRMDKTDLQMVVSSIRPYARPLKGKDFSFNLFEFLDSQLYTYRLKSTHRLTETNSLPVRYITEKIFADLGSSFAVFKASGSMFHVLFIDKSTGTTVWEKSVKNPGIIAMREVDYHITRDSITYILLENEEGKTGIYRIHPKKEKLEKLVQFKERTGNLHLTADEKRLLSGKYLYDIALKKTISFQLPHPEKSVTLYSDTLAEEILFFEAGDTNRLLYCSFYDPSPFREVILADTVKLTTIAAAHPYHPQLVVKTRNDTRLAVMYDRNNGKPLGKLLPKNYEDSDLKDKKVNLPKIKAAFDKNYFEQGYEELTINNTYHIQPETGARINFSNLSGNYMLCMVSEGYHRNETISMSTSGGGSETVKISSLKEPFRYYGYTVVELPIVTSQPTSYDMVVKSEAIKNIGLSVFLYKKKQN